MELLINNIDSRDMDFKNYNVEQLYIRSIYSKLTTDENKVRRAIMEYTINEGKSFNENSEDVCIISEVVNIPVEIVKNLINSIEEKLGLAKDEEGNINFIYPVCAVPTNHKVTLKDGRSFHAMCAVDAIGTAFTFKQDVCIESVCSKCGQEVKVEVEAGKIKSFTPENLHVLHVDLNKHTNWAGNC